MFPILAVVGQNSAPPAPAWNKVLEMKFNGNFADSTGRHSPVSYGAVISTAQSVEGGSSMYANQDGRVFTDNYGGDHPDFDFTGRNFRVVCRIRPISIGNDYVWCKTSGGNLGVNLKLGLAGSDPVVYLWPMVTDVGAIVPDLLTGKWTKVEVQRIGSTWSLLIDDVVVSSAVSDAAPWLGAWEGGSGFKAFLLAGAANSDRYSGWIDQFEIYIN